MTEKVTVGSVGRRNYISSRPRGREHFVWLEPTVGGRWFFSGKVGSSGVILYAKLEFELGSVLLSK